jgi:hypothetical protein
MYVLIYGISLVVFASWAEIPAHLSKSRKIRQEKYRLDDYTSYES